MCAVDSRLTTYHVRKVRNHNVEQINTSTSSQYPVIMYTMTHSSTYIYT